MEKFEKEFDVAGNVVVGIKQIHVVRIVSDGQTVHAHCDCMAGEHKTLCKHVLKCIDEDKEIRYALTQCGYLQVYEEHLMMLKEAEKMKREAKNLKKKFERLFLE